MDLHPNDGRPPRPRPPPGSRAPAAPSRLVWVGAGAPSIRIQPPSAPGSAAWRLLTPHTLLRDERPHPGGDMAGEHRGTGRATLLVGCCRDPQHRNRAGFV